MGQPKAAILVLKPSAGKHPEYARGELWDRERKGAKTQGPDICSSPGEVNNEEQGPSGTSNLALPMEHLQDISHSTECSILDS